MGDKPRLNRPSLPKPPPARQIKGSDSIFTKYETAIFLIGILVGEIITGIIVVIMLNT